MGNTGHKHSDETKAKMRGARLGKTMSIETREKLRAAKLGKPCLGRRGLLVSVEQALVCEELWNINNGVTLCIPCHRKRHSKITDD